MSLTAGAIRLRAAHTQQMIRINEQERMVDMQGDWSMLVWIGIAATAIVAGIAGVKARQRLRTTRTPVVQYGYKVSARDPGA